jgi:NTE family protein
VTAGWLGGGVFAGIFQDARARSTSVLVFRDPQAIGPGAWGWHSSGMAREKHIGEAGLMKRPAGSAERLVESVVERVAPTLLEDTAVRMEGREARPGVGLALGGGFARGFAHLGVLQVFEENHIEISHIAGTSVGSILGAAYASGAPLAKIMATCRTLRFRDIARWHVSRLGLASNHRLADLIENVFESRRFEDLRIPMAVVATNLNTGEPVVFSEGSLVDPIRASCAFPGIFEPVEIGTRWLVDGGLTAPVPAQAARKMGAKFVIGVSVGMQDGHSGKPATVFQVVTRAVCAAQKHQQELWERHADLAIRPDVQTLAWDDFHRADEAIEAGKKAAKLALPRIHRMLENAQPEIPHFAYPKEFEDSGLHFITEAMGS